MVQTVDMPLFQFRIVKLDSLVRLAQTARVAREESSVSVQVMKSSYGLFLITQIPVAAISSGA